MPELIMSVSTGRLPAGATYHCDALFSAFWLCRGGASVAAKSVRLGEGMLLRGGETAEFVHPGGAEWIRFDLRRDATSPDALLSSGVSLPVQPKNAACLLRLDQVIFPPGAVAYRHVHAGDGIRFLVSGSLQVKGDTEQSVATPGHAWFEAANTPVRAEASKTEAQTSFVRFMVLPSVYVGKPTIRILDEAEAQLPRKQVTHRHFDELAYFSPG